MKKYILLLLVPALFSCDKQERNCQDFKTGNFKSEIMVKGVKKESFSIRRDSVVIETYEGKTDTSTVRWVNDCEFIMQKKHPRSMKERRTIAMKILTTSKNSYTFEFGDVDSDTRQKGTATKLNQMP